MRQIISTNPTNIEATPDSPVSFDVVYNVDPAQNLNGLGLRLHFDSEALTFDSASNLFSNSNIIAPQQVQPETTNEDDGDPSTDRFILASWVDFSGDNWPGDSNLPTTLYTANFTTSETFESTSINFTAPTGGTANGFDLDAASVTIEEADAAPIVANPIADVIAEEDVEPPAISLSEVFSDLNGDEIRIIAQSNNRDLVQTSITDGNLNLLLQPNASGIAEITLTGIANDKEVTETFSVTVNEINDPPTIEDTVFSIVENKVNDAEVGRILIENVDGVEDIVFALADSTNIDVDGDGIKPFAIAPVSAEQTNTGRIIVTDRDDLDFEQQSSFNLEVTATDSSGAVDTANVTVNLTDLPLVENNGIFSVEKAANFAFDLTGGESDSVNEVGLFTVDNKLGTIDGVEPGQEGYLARAFERSQSLLSALAEPPEGFEGEIRNIANFQPGTNFGLYLIPNDTSDRVKAQLAGTGTTNVDVLFSTEDNLLVTEREDGGLGLSWEELAIGGDNVADFNDLQLGLQEVQQTPVFARNPDNPELLDLTQINADTVEFRMTLNSEALFENEVALYEIKNMNGGIEVEDPLTGEKQIINPSVANQEEYRTGVLNNLDTSTRFSVANGETFTSESRELETGKIYAPALLSTDSAGELNVFTPFLGTNSDRKDHVRSLGDNILGFEDRLDGGDLDYNDLVVEFEFL